MDVTPMVRADQQIIQSYANKKFRVSGKTFETPIMVFPDVVEEWNVSEAFEDLTESHFQFLIDKADDIDVVLLGCGAHMAFLSPELKVTLKDKGLSIDTMDTGAACRTYNVLMAEGRRVVAALFLS